MIFSDIFPVSYATFCGVQLGESFVSRPANIGAGEWMKFFEILLNEYDSNSYIAIEEYVKEINELNDENQSLEEENDDLREEVARLEKIVDEQDEKIAKLEEDCDRMDYEMGRP